MRRKIPCRGNEGWVYQEGNDCFECDLCPVGHGRNLSKKVLNSTRIQGDMECLECEPCLPNQYNNGGRKSCEKCLQDCAKRNRHNCPSTATQPCGDCLKGYYEEYQIPDDPSTCTPCTEKDIHQIPACANITTSTRAASTQTRDNHIFSRNISGADVKKAAEMGNGYTTDGTNTRIDIIIGLCSIGILVALVVVVYYIYKHCKRRRKKRKRKESDLKNPQQTESPKPLLLSSSAESQVSGEVLSYSKPVMIDTLQDTVVSPLTENTDENSYICPLRPGISGNTERDVSVTLLDSGGDNDLQTNSKPVAKQMDYHNWFHEQELLKSNVSIHQLCAKRWIDLDQEYQVLGLSETDVWLLEKEAQQRCWTPEELNFQILTKWTQKQAKQATLQALCDALSTHRHCDIIEIIMKEHS